MSTGHPGIRDYALLLLLSAIWGSSFLFIKIAVDTVPAVTVTAVRITTGAAILFAAARMAGQKLPSGARVWTAIAAAALFGNALPFSLISWGEEHIDSGLAAILMAVMPLTTVLLAHMFTADEKLSARKVVGVILGFSGLVVLMGPEKLAQLGDETVRQLAVAGAAVCYGINAIITKRLMHLPRRALAAALMMVATAMIVPASLIIDRPWTLQPSMTAWSTMFVLGVFHTAIATLLMFAVIRKQGASFFSQINFLIPIFGVLYGALILAERPSANAYLALALILLGIAVVRGRGRPADRATDAPSAAR